MFEAIVLVAAVAGACLVLAAVLEVAGGVLRASLAVALFPLHVLGAVVALVCGALLLPLVLLGLVLGALGLVAGVVLAPLVPLAALALGAWGLVRLVQPRRG
jgi:hypothetical protein